MSPIERSSGGGGGGFSNPMTTAGDIIIENAVPAAARLAIGASAQTLGISGGLPAWVTPPGFEFGYDQITAIVNVVGTTEATATTIIAGSSYTFDGAAVLATFFCPFIQDPTGGVQQITVSLWEGATEITRMGIYFTSGGAPQVALGATYVYRFTPSAAAHTYTVKAHVNVTTGTPQVGAGAGGVAAYAPAFLRITKV